MKVLSIEHVFRSLVVYGLSLQLSSGAAAGAGLVNARRSAIFVIQYIMYEQQERFFIRHASNSLDSFVLVQGQYCQVKSPAFDTCLSIHKPWLLGEMNG